MFIRLIKDEGFDFDSLKYATAPKKEPDEKEVIALNEFAEIIRALFDLWEFDVETMRYAELDQPGWAGRLQTLLEDRHQEQLDYIFRHASTF